MSRILTRPEMTQGPAGVGPPCSCPRSSRNLFRRRKLSVCRSNTPPTQQAGWRVWPSFCVRRTDAPLAWPAVTRDSSGKPIQTICQVAAGELRRHVRDERPRGRRRRHLLPRQQRGDSRHHRWHVADDRSRRTGYALGVATWVGSVTGTALFPWITTASAIRGSRVRPA